MATQPFPSTATGRKSALWLMRRHAPELMAQIEELRQAFGGTLTYFKAGPLEWGDKAPEGWQVDERLLRRVKEAEAATAMALAFKREAERQERLRIARSRRAR